MKHVAIYVRVSTKKQSTELQKERLIEYCKKRGYNYSIYSDEGYSGKSGKRPGFRMLINDIKNGKKFDAVIVTKFDRFARSIQDLINTVTFLRDNNISFIAIDNNVDTSSSQGRLLFHLLGAIAEFEREIIVERMAEGRKKALEEGKTCHRPKLELDRNQIIKWKKKGIGNSSIAKLCNTSRVTIWRRIKEWEKEGYIIPTSKEDNYERY